LMMNSTVIFSGGRSISMIIYHRDTEDTKKGVRDQFFSGSCPLNPV